MRMVTLCLLACALAQPALTADARSSPLKLLRYGAAGQEKPGLLDADGNIRDLSRVIRDITPAELAPAALARLRALDARRLPLVKPGARLGVPVQGIRKIVAVGLNYAAHAREGGNEPPSEPILFLKATTALAGPDDDVIRPRGSTALDYECELVIVIGQTARYVRESEAGDYIAGYSVGNDVSERDFQQRRQGQWTKGKSADTFAHVGPYLVEASAVKETELDLWLKVNDATRQSANTREMIFKPKFLVSYISQFMTLEPGDIIYSGTPEGVAAGMKPPAYLQPGDRVDLGIQGVGEEHHRVVAFEDSPLATAEDQLQALEQRRIAAIRAGDPVAMRELLADDYQHVHGNGEMEDLATFLKGVPGRKRETLRGPLSTRVYGAVAVITGQQTNRTKAADGSTNDVSYYVTQVARQQGGHWRYVNMQVTPLKPNDPAKVLTGDESTYVRGGVDPHWSADQKAVAALEARRAAAIAERDFDTLAGVLAEDYLHVYGGGSTGGRADYLEQVRRAPRVPTRGPLTVRVYGDVAVMSGNLLNRIQYPDQPERVLDTFVTQVARKVDGQWKFVSFQITQKTRP